MKLTTQLVMVCAGLGGAAVLISGWMIQRSATQEFRTFLRASDLAVMDDVTRRVGDSLRAGQGPEELLRIAQFSQRHLLLFEDSGKLVAAAPPELASTRIVRPTPREIQIAWQQGTHQASVEFRLEPARFSPGSGKPELLLYVLPPFLSNQPAPRAQFLDSVRRSAVAAAGLALLAVLLIAWPLSRAVLRPVAELTRAAQAMKAGDLTQRVTVRSADEVAALGTAFNALAASLQRQEQLRRDLVNDVAHELRTPLTNLRCQVDSMLDGLAAPTPQTLESLQEEILLLNRLVDDLRDLAQAEAGQLALSFEEINLAAELPRIAALHQQEAGQKGVRLTVHADGPLLVRADPARLSQIVRNLISNALTHTAAGGEVSVEAQRQGGHVTIDVRDNGAGIEAAHLPFVFDRFYRADPSRQRASGGAGLGLAIARQLAQAQGGSIGVESAPGIGSTFTVRLPGVF